MTKTDAVDLFGDRVRLARALGVTPQAVYQWPEKLTRAKADQVLGAALRLRAGSARALYRLALRCGD